MPWFQSVGNLNKFFLHVTISFHQISFMKTFLCIAQYEKRGRSLILWYPGKFGITSLFCSIIISSASRISTVSIWVSCKFSRISVNDVVITLLIWKQCFLQETPWIRSFLRGGFRTTTTSNLELFVIIVLTIITKSSSLDVTAVLDPPLRKRLSSLIEIALRYGCSLL